MASTLKKVILNADVFAVMLQHALLNEEEEMMGLLIGEINRVDNSVEIVSVAIDERNVRKKDRVEMAPEMVMKASGRAETLARELQRPLTVAGWYHSHPHITVEPSHVDVNTQATYQNMDPLFVGLILSVFNSDQASLAERITLVCFQAHNPPSHRRVPLQLASRSVAPYNLDLYADMPDVLLREMSLEGKEYQEGQIIQRLYDEADQNLNMVQLLSEVLLPMCEAFETRNKVTDKQIEALKAKKESLLRELAKQKEEKQMTEPLSLSDAETQIM